MHVWKIDTSVNFENIMARSIIDKALITIDAIIQWTNYRKLFFFYRNPEKFSIQLYVPRTSIKF